jgi:hypothetical protein
MIPSGSGNTASIYNLFDTPQFDPTNGYSFGSTSSLTYSSYEVTVPGNYNIISNFSIDYRVQNNNESGSFTFQIWKNGVLFGQETRTFSNAGSTTPVFVVAWNKRTGSVGGDFGLLEP